MLEIFCGILSKSSGLGRRCGPEHEYTVVESDVKIDELRATNYQIGNGESSRA
jgi:hypothetical protein